ncbi:response regulator [Flavobacterium sp. 1355]|uniref:response regulator n=1 Tax=Flavobacterium sp. 1355 TaxID=2806571 RepID=UPI001AE53FED|nr:response regulator [Flavobacterium sp. 1355]MBP1221771.1 CheY-like chemotaxis protein [Flavobacterium sp. 1355]
MNINGEIIVVEDDQDDREFLADIFESLKITNKIVFFDDSTKVVSYLSKVEVKPFLVLSDINMPKMDGYELRTIILKDDLLSKKCIPYIFLSTSKDPENIHRAFALSAHGYFKKEENFKTYQEVISNIISYWKMSQIPRLY